MSMVVCPSCGDRVSDYKGFCPRCGYQFPNKPPQRNRNRKGHSPLSIAAIICSIIVFPIGFIICIIDLVKNDKNYKHTLSIVGLVISVLFCFFALGNRVITTEETSAKDEEATTTEAMLIKEDNTDNIDESLNEITDTINEIKNDPEVQQSYEKYNDSLEAEKAEEQSSQTSEVEISEDEFKASCQEFNYKQIARNPDDYIGQNFKVNVKVLSSSKGGFLSDYDVYYKAFLKSEIDTGDLELDLDDMYLGEMIFVIDCQDKNSPSYLKILDDDIITVYGTFNGMSESKNALTNETSETVALYMKYAELISE